MPVAVGGEDEGLAVGRPGCVVVVLRGCQEGMFIGAVGGCDEELQDAGDNAACPGEGEFAGRLCGPHQGAGGDGYGQGSHQVEYKAFD